MPSALEEFILRELKERGCRSVHYWAETQGTVLRTLVDANSFRISCLGMTGLPVEQRFENHKRGYKRSTHVRQYGLRLRPEFYDRINPMTQRDAVLAEKKLAHELRAESYTVVGGT